MTESEVQFAGKLSALEYVLEVMLANEMARWPEDEAQAFCEDLFNREGYIQKGPVEVALVEALQHQTRAALENFLAKAQARADDLRAKLT